MPLWNRLICGVPKVLPRLAPHPATLVQASVAEVHSPMTRLAALLSVNPEFGLVISSA
jgi:hypothetical protein